MVQRVITERFDDLDGSPANETVRFGYAGRSSAEAGQGREWVATAIF